jgi:outer membrane receptor protein involved in Fe transport
VAYPNSTATDARRDVNAPSYYLVNSGLAYTWAMGRDRTKQTIRVSAKNLLDRDYVDQRGNLGAGRGVYFAYTLAH